MTLLLRLPSGRKYSEASVNVNPRLVRIQDDLDIAFVVKQINKGDLSELTALDELKAEMAKNSILFRFHEPQEFGKPIVLVMKVVWY